MKTVVEALREITPRIEAGELTPAQAADELVAQTGISRGHASELVGDLPEDENVTV